MTIETQEGARRSRMFTDHVAIVAFGRTDGCIGGIQCTFISAAGRVCGSAAVRWAFEDGRECVPSALPLELAWFPGHGVFAAL